MNPQARGRHEQLSWALLAQERVADAEAAVMQEHEEVFRIQGLAMVRWTQGRVAESDALLAELIQRFGVSAAYQVAELHAHRGEVDAAFNWLERAYAGYDPGMFWARTTRFFQSLHGDPRWPAYLHKLGFGEG